MNCYVILVVAGLVVVAVVAIVFFVVCRSGKQSLVVTADGVQKLAGQSAEKRITYDYDGRVIPEHDIGPQELGAYYFVPDWMKAIEQGLVQRYLARRLTGGEKTKTGFTFYYEVENWHLTEVTREPEVTVIVGEFAKVYEAVSLILNENDGTKILRLVEDYANGRQGREETRIHQCIIQVMIARALALLGPGYHASIRGDFGLVGRLKPGSKLEVHGNVDTIEGSTGELLIVHGNVRQLGCGPFWSPNAVGGEAGRIEIHGNVWGYKSKIDNPELEIEIHGDVLTQCAFYCSGKLKKLTVHGKFHCGDGAFAGIFEGEVQLLGDAPGLRSYILHHWRDTSAGSYGKANIYHRGYRLIGDGQNVGV